MTSQGNGSRPVYIVRFSGISIEQVRQRYEEAVDAGNVERFLMALRTIVERLKHEPQTFGEPLYRLPALGLMVYQCALSPLFVDYGVHEERPFVFIRGVRTLS